METPTHVNPLWRVIKAAAVIELEALFVLQDDTMNKNSSNDPPFVVLAGGEYLVAPKYVWRTGRQALNT